MFRRSFSFGLRKNKAPVRWSMRQEQKKNDLDTSDKMSSDDDLVPILVKIRSKTKSGYKEKAPVKRRKFSYKEKAPVKKRKFSRDPRLGETCSDDDSMVLKPEKRRRKVPVKTRKFRRDPRLGAAQRIRDSFQDVIRNWDTPVPGSPVSDSDIYKSASIEPGINIRDEIREMDAYIEEHFPKSGKEWFKQYDAPLKDLEKNEEKYLAERDYTVALKAVKFYNRKHSTNYVVEETLGSYLAEFDDGIWTHCNFRAKNTAGRRPVSRLFFAELFGDVGRNKVDSCVTLDGPGHCRDIVHGCEMCPKWVCHPVHGFKNGHPDEYTPL